MSNYHVKTQNEAERSAQVIFHIPIPVENNGVGVALRTAVSEYVKPRLEDGTFGVFQSQVVGIVGSELTQLRNGELYEKVENINFLATDYNAQKQTKIDNRYTALTIGGLNRIRKVLKFWGLNRDVP